MTATQGPDEETFCLPPRTCLVPGASCLGRRHVYRVKNASCSQKEKLLTPSYLRSQQVTADLYILVDSGCLRRPHPDVASPESVRLAFLSPQTPLTTFLDALYASEPSREPHLSPVCLTSRRGMFSCQTCLEVLTF